MGCHVATAPLVAGSALEVVLAYMGATLAVRDEGVELQDGVGGSMISLGTAAVEGEATVVVAQEHVTDPEVERREHGVGK